VEAGGVTQAVVFDLDDTLYPERRFALSGFAAVSLEVERTYGVAAREAFAVLRRALAIGRRDRALQRLCMEFSLPFRAIEELRDVIRTHDPRLRLPKTTRSVLEALRPVWRTGVLTNGRPETQARKVEALGLGDLVDRIVYASEVGPGKPDHSAFRAVLAALGCDPADSVFVGDDSWYDMFGARAVGMKTIRIRRGATAAAAFAGPRDADYVAESLAEVPALARALVEGAPGLESETHVA
jgi:putative hydrolase of the HAD superfamily